MKQAFTKITFGLARVLPRGGFPILALMANLFPADYPIFNIKNGFPFRQLNGFNKTNNYIPCSEARRGDVSALIKLDLLELV